MALAPFSLAGTGLGLGSVLPCWGWSWPRPRSRPPALILAPTLGPVVECWPPRRPQVRFPGTDPHTDSGAPASEPRCPSCFGAIRSPHQRFRPGPQPHVASNRSGLALAIHRLRRTWLQHPDTCQVSTVALCPMARVQGAAQRTKGSWTGKPWYEGSTTAVISPRLDLTHSSTAAGSTAAFVAGATTSNPVPVRTAAASRRTIPFTEPPAMVTHSNHIRAHSNELPNAGCSKLTRTCRVGGPSSGFCYGPPFGAGGSSPNGPASGWRGGVGRSG